MQPDRRWTVQSAPLAPPRSATEGEDTAAPRAQGADRRTPAPAPAGARGSDYAIGSLSLWEALVRHAVPTGDDQALFPM